MTKYQKYADLKILIKELSEKAKEMESELFTEISDIEGNKLETDFATFSIMYRPKWKYSDELNIKEQGVKDKLKLMKKEEEVKGIATKISDNGFLRCQIKENK